MMNTQNKVSRTVTVRGSSTPLLAVTGSGEVNALSLVVREYIARHCVTLASLMLERSVSLSRDEQAQTNNKNNRPIPKRA